jgi:hypothetical protein
MPKTTITKKRIYTLWSMMLRIRKAMKGSQAELLNGIVEMDEFCWRFNNKENPAMFSNLINNCVL